jgi:signal transduction histidine kinase
MNAVIGMTRRLPEENFPPEQKGYLEIINIIRNSVWAMFSLISDLLDFTRIEKEKVTLERQPFSMRSCIEESLELVFVQANKNGLRSAHIVKHCAPDAFIGDPGRRRQILVALLSNAVKFTDAGEISVSVSSEDLGDNKHQLCFAVKDTGIGIPKEKMDLHFLPFSQIETTISRKRDGTGLGLAICKGLVELMGGEIRAESILGKGSTFYFAIEAEVAKDTSIKPEMWVQPVENISEKSPLRILVAKDNPSNRRGSWWRCLKRWATGQIQWPMETRLSSPWKGNLTISFSWM